jgi:calcineurin-like phosphoesterase family protein
MTVFFTSDTHFGEARILRAAKRPFATITEHDEVLKRGWNETVGEDDEIWHLGDVGIAPGADGMTELLEKLRGRKHLIIGNNDGPKTLASPAWTSVQHYTELRLGEAHCILCHYAFRTWNQMGKGSIDLHGHSHAMLKELTRQYDVGVDAWGYRPVTLETMLASRRRGKAKNAS